MNETSGQQALLRPLLVISIVLLVVGVGTSLPYTLVQTSYLSKFLFSVGSLCLWTLYMVWFVTPFWRIGNPSPSTPIRVIVFGVVIAMSFFVTYLAISVSFAQTGFVLLTNGSVSLPVGTIFVFCFFGVMVVSSYQMTRLVRRLGFTASWFGTLLLYFYLPIGMFYLSRRL